MSTPGTPTPPLSDDARCPCLSGLPYGECCGPLHRGAAAPTAERLMRSRFSAFALGDVEHLRRTWHPSTCPATIELDAGIRWYRLDIVSTTLGGALDTEGTVEFVAYYRSMPGAAERVSGEQHENSRFTRYGVEWRYLDEVERPSR